MDEIVNKVANSGLLSIDLEEFYDHTPIVAFDMKDHLFQGLILREKDFRGFIKDADWSTYQDKYVALFCSADAIVPTWAYMLVANRLSGIAKEVFWGSPEELQSRLIKSRIDDLDLESYRDQRVVVKGCSNLDVPVGAYVALTNRLTPVVKSMMFGEPCSTVPIYKKRT